MLDKRKLDDYRAMMADRVRMRAYRAAIGQVVPGRSVVELGVGLAPLSLMALQAGARRVYGIELDSEVLEVATRIVRAHGFDEDRFVPLPGLSTEVELPERVDVVLSETVDALGLGENTVHFTADARERFLVPGGVFLPRGLECFVALADSRHHRGDRRFWGTQLQDFEGLDYSLLLPLLSHLRNSFPLQEDELRSNWVRWQQIDFRQPWPGVEPEVRVELSATRNGDIGGLATAFRIELSDGIWLDNFTASAPTHWQQGFLPLPDLYPTRVGDGYSVDLRCHPHDHPGVALTCELHPLIDQQEA